MSSEPETKTEDKSLFTAKEEAAMKVAWQCLKSVPEIDMEKFKDKAGFNTIKTAQNTWGVIKRKLFTNEDGNVIMPSPAKSANGEPTTPKKTPKKGTATPKKRGKKNDESDSDDDDQPTPAKKKGRKTPSKKEVKGKPRRRMLTKVLPPPMMRPPSWSVVVEVAEVR
ncbi:putative tRNA threonylcarbamoyladenosine biosynthesis protein kae1 [Taxawa tesnikishii (nom. ined.)]|nr:putative tRNA threonylcarbamoyladenosine biosynthesis protein kae1 [Dothideales sp. JES 119]